MKPCPENKRFLLVDPCGNTVLLTMEQIESIDEMRKALSDPEIVKKVVSHNTIGEIVQYLKDYLRGKVEE